MKSLLITTLFIFLVSLVSCGSKSDNKEQPVVSPAATNTTPLPFSTKNENTTSNNAALPVLNNTSQVSLNPEHGKPGHRCDIAVGAPLTGAPANKTAMPITNSNTPANSVGLQPSAPIMTVASGMNPQHGQPGHRCDIAVGAPLTSAPANKPAMPITNSNPPANNVGIQPTAPVMTVPSGINPQHGQPGHRCDIAVGAPLNSKPIQ